MNQPKDLKNFLKRLKETLSCLHQHFPEAFSETNIRPLKIGIHYDIFTMKIEGMPPKKWVNIALKYYVNSRPYLSAIKENVSRIDLNGNAVGIVSKEQYDSANNNPIKYTELKAKKLTSKKNESSTQINTRTEAESIEKKKVILTLKKKS